MAGPTFYIVDVFAERKYAGNQLAVFCFGVPEDPATGSANGCLAGYLVQHRYFGGDTIDIRSEQGYEIGRPSLLLLKAERRNAAIDIYVGGQGVLVAHGALV